LSSFTFDSSSWLVFQDLNSLSLFFSLSLSFSLSSPRARILLPFGASYSYSYSYLQAISPHVFSARLSETVLQDGEEEEEIDLGFLLIFSRFRHWKE
jgi:hypothetical protein